MKIRKKRHVTDTVRVVDVIKFTNLYQWGNKRVITWTYPILRVTIAHDAGVVRYFIESYAQVPELDGVE